MLPSCSNTSFVIPKLTKNKKHYSIFWREREVLYCQRQAFWGTWFKVSRLAIYYVRLGTALFISKLLCFSTVAVVSQKPFLGDLQSYCSHQKYMSKQCEESRWSMPDLWLPDSRGVLAHAMAAQ